MDDFLTPDLCVIGAGSGGLSVAAAARAVGASVVLVEKGEMGGDCLNTGCVPSKALIAAARHAHAVNSGKPFGIATDELRVQYGRVNEHIHEVIAGIAPHDSVARYEAMGVTVLRAEGRFIDKKTLAAGDVNIRARRFVVATGSRPAIPPLPGLETVAYETNETIFNLRRRPAHLLIIGGGPIGMEMAAAYRRLGAEVSVFEGATPLGRNDPELAEIVLRSLRAEGIAIHAGVEILGLSTTAQGIELRFRQGEDEHRVAGSNLLIAAGRTPNIEDMGLDAARVRTNARGIVTNASLRSTNPRIYAVGDVAGSLQFTHMASYQAGIVIRKTLFGLPVRQRVLTIPHATYTDPEIAEVGYSEALARKKLGDRFRVIRFPIAENDRARTERDTVGLVKIIAAANGRILGAGIVGKGASEMIALYALAISKNIRMADFAALVVPYPTRAEIAKRAGIEFYRDRLSSPWLKRIMALNRLLP